MVGPVWGINGSVQAFGRPALKDSTARGSVSGSASLPAFRVHDQLGRLAANKDCCRPCSPGFVFSHDGMSRRSTGWIFWIRRESRRSGIVLAIVVKDTRNTCGFRKLFAGEEADHADQTFA